MEVSDIPEQIKSYVCLPEFDNVLSEYKEDERCVEPITTVNMIIVIATIIVQIIKIVNKELTVADKPLVTRYVEAIMMNDSVVQKCDDGAKEFIGEVQSTEDAKFYDEVLAEVNKRLAPVIVAPPQKKVKTSCFC